MAKVEREILWAVLRQQDHWLALSVRKRDLIDNVTVESCEIGDAEQAVCNPFSYLARDATRLQNVVGAHGTKVTALHGRTNGFRKYRIERLVKGHDDKTAWSVHCRTSASLWSNALLTGKLGA